MLSIDADVLVRPSHVGRFLSVLRAQGWTRAFDFADGSAFEHAATWLMDGLSSLDVHRYFPGIEIDPEVAFDQLWQDKSESGIAGIPCSVPDLAGQRLIVLVHAARGRSSRDHDDRRRAWYALDEGAQAEIDALGDRLGARVALRAATGRLDSVRDHRTYPLWRLLSEGGHSLPELWWARVRAAQNPVQAVRLGVRMVLPNRRRMAYHLGRMPNHREVARAYAERFRFGLRVLSKARGRRGER